MDRTPRVTAAALVLAGGAVHVRLAETEYQFASGFARAFAINALVSAVAAAWIVLRRDVIGPALCAAVSAGSLAAFALNRAGVAIGGIEESGLNPAPQALIVLLLEAGALTVSGYLLYRLLGPRRGAPA